MRVLVLGMAALLLAAALGAPLAAAAPSTVAVLKRAPQAEDPDASGSDDDGATVGVQVNPSSGKNRTVQIVVRADDPNGHNDIATVGVTILKSDNATVHVTSSTATKTAGAGKRGTFVYTFNMRHFDAPGLYHVHVQVTDRDGEIHQVYATFTYNALAALSLSTGSVSLGPGGDGGASVAPDSSTHDAPSSVTITNTGNVVVDLQYSGTDLANATLGTTIGVGNVHLSTSASMANETAVGTSPATDTGFDLAPGESSSKTVYFAIHVPEGTRPGTYAGTLTLAAVAN